MHNSFIKAIASSCSCEFDTDWHERKMFKFVIPFLFKRLWEKRVCPKASGDTAMLWSIRVCDGFCIDHENVGWWSGLEGAVGWRWGGGGGCLWVSSDGCHITQTWQRSTRTCLPSSSFLSFLTRSSSLWVSYILPLLGSTLLTVWLVKNAVGSSCRLWKARSMLERMKE